MIPTSKMQGHDPIKEETCCTSKSFASEWSTCWFCGQYQIVGADHFRWSFLVQAF